MGLFGKMFEKKNCDICGGEIGLLGNKKLEDGNLCKECASKLSPWFSDRRRSTVDQIREQLDWREANQQRVAQFNPTRTLGNDMKVILDEDVGRFIVTRSSRWREANPDVLDFSQVTGCDTEIRGYVSKSVSFGIIHCLYLVGIWNSSQTIPVPCSSGAPSSRFDSLDTAANSPSTSSSVGMTRRISAAGSGLSVCA